MIFLREKVKKEVKKQQNKKEQKVMSWLQR